MCRRFARRTGGRPAQSTGSRLRGSVGPAGSVDEVAAQQRLERAVRRHAHRPAAVAADVVVLVGAPAAVADVDAVLAVLRDPVQPAYGLARLPARHARQPVAVDVVLLHVGPAVVVHVDAARRGVVVYLVAVHLGLPALPDLDARQPVAEDVVVRHGAAPVVVDKHAVLRVGADAVELDVRVGPLRHLDARLRVVVDVVVLDDGLCAVEDKDARAAAVVDAVAPDARLGVLAMDRDAREALAAHVAALHVELPSHNVDAAPKPVPFLPQCDSREASELRLCNNGVLTI